jgi:hypothetical protein
MIASLQNLVHALREELQQYGEMLALLERQQEYVITRAADDMLQTASAIHQQTAILQNVRRQREQCQQLLAAQLQLPEKAGFAVIIPVLPEDYRPLVQALVEENNELLAGVQKRARQNHLLLGRAVELMQRFMSTLLPAFRPTTYDGGGNVLSGSGPARTLYEAVG